MSNLKRGRPKKGFNNKKTHFDIERFAEVLKHFPKIDIKKWSLNKEWVEFTKIYYSCSYPKEKHIRGSRDFFMKNSRYFLSLNRNDSKKGICCNEDDVCCKQSFSNESSSTYSFSDQLDPDEISDENEALDKNIFLKQTGKIDTQIEGSVKRAIKDENNPYFYFPNVTNIEGSIFLVNCNGANINGLDETVKRPVLTTKMPSNHESGSSGPSHSSSLCNNNDTYLSTEETVPSVKGEKNRKIEIPPVTCIPTDNTVDQITEVDECSVKNCVNFTVQKQFIIKIDNCKWNNFFSKAENFLPYNWSKHVSIFLSECIPNCCINFKRRKLYSRNSQFIAKFWFYCSIEGCTLNGTAQLDKK